MAKLAGSDVGAAGCAWDDVVKRSHECRACPLRGGLADDEVANRVRTALQQVGIGHISAEIGLDPTWLADDAAGVRISAVQFHGKYVFCLFGVVVGNQGREIGGVL